MRSRQLDTRLPIDRIKQASPRTQRRLLLLALLLRSSASA